MRTARCWERPPQGPAEEDDKSRGPHGVLSLYTWQSRRIRLVGDEDAITGVVLAKVTGLLEQPSPARADDRLATQQEQRAAKGGLVYLPALHDPARALWRGLDQSACRARPPRWARKAPTCPGGSASGWPSCIPVARSTAATA